MAELIELPTLRWPLVKKFYKANGHKGHPRGGEQVFALYQETEMVAAVRLCPLPNSDDGRLLRSLWVARKHREQGVGSLFLALLTPELKRAPVWCYPYPHLESFYLRSGFVPAEAAQTPTSVTEPWQRYQQKGHHYLLMRYAPS